VRVLKSGLDNSGWKSRCWWPTKLLTRCGEQCEFNWPRLRAVSRGQWVTSDNRERVVWLVNWGHGGLGGGPERSGTRCGGCTVHWCRGMLGRIFVFLFLVGHTPHHQSWPGGSSRGEQLEAVMETTAKPSWWWEPSTFPSSTVLTLGTSLPVPPLTSCGVKKKKKKKDKSVIGVSIFVRVHAGLKLPFDDKNAVYLKQPRGTFIPWNLFLTLDYQSCHVA